MPSLRACKVIGRIGVIGFHRGDAVRLVADLQERHVDVRAQPFALQQEARGEIRITAEAADRDALHFLDALDALAAEDAIIHRVAQSPEHHQIERRSRDYHLRREHADLCVIRRERRGGGGGALDKN
jgi:hypothetical protein